MFVIELFQLFYLRYVEKTRVFMRVHALADSRTYFEISDYILPGRGSCLDHRIAVATTFFGTLFLLPVALFYKLCRTFLKFAGVFVSACLLLSTFGKSFGLRNLFIRRITQLAVDFADWFLFPFALLLG